MATRRASRVRTHSTTQVGFVGIKEKFAAPLLEFSPFGLSVESSREVAMGTVFRLGIQAGSEYIRAAAVVRAKLPNGFAVEFLSMNSIDRETLRRLYLRLQAATRTG